MGTIDEMRAECDRRIAEMDEEIAAQAARIRELEGYLASASADFAELYQPMIDAARDERDAAHRARHEAEKRERQAFEWVMQKYLTPEEYDDLYDCDWRDYLAQRDATNATNVTNVITGEPATPETAAADVCRGEPVAWRPIDTAPKDGTRFLASYDVQDGRRVVFVQWVDGRWRTDGGMWIEPTHYMPAPEPPGEEAQ